MRTRKTLSDKGMWLAVNKLAGRLVITSILICLSMAALVPSTSMNWRVHLGGFAFPVLASFLVIHFIRKF